MSLKETLLHDLKDAMKSKDALRRDVIQIIRAGVLQIEKDNQIELDDAGVADILAKELKKRCDVLPDYERSGRQDLIDEIHRQMDIIKSYLPEQLSEDEINDIVIREISETGATGMKDMGRVMAAVTAQIKGRANNKLVSEMIKKRLTN